MKTNLNDKEWHEIYPIFGHLFGTCMLSAAKRHMGTFGTDVEMLRLLQHTSQLNFSNIYTLEKLIELLKNGLGTDELSKKKQTPISALSVSQITRFSRESTRRKLKKLEEMGFLEYVKDDPIDGYITTTKTLSYYYEENRKIYENFARMCNMVEELQENLGMTNAQRT